MKGKDKPMKMPEQKHNDKPMKMPEFKQKPKQDKEPWKKNNRDKLKRQNSTRFKYTMKIKK